MSTTVALVGRTNVGKSSLFNKLAKSKSALVSEQEGLTRDIKSTSIHLGGKSINLIAVSYTHLTLPTIYSV